MAESEELSEENRARGRTLFQNSNSGNSDGSRDEHGVEHFQLMRSYFDQQFKSLKRELCEEVHSTSSSTLKKFKDVSSSKEFRYVGNKRQFSFNLDILDGLCESEDLIRRGEQLKSLDAISSVKKKVERRNKLIRIADKSVGGWETVNEYESDDLASDTDDDKRLKRAETRAVAKQKARRQGKRPLPSQSPAPAGISRSFAPAPAFVGSVPEPGNVVPFFRGSKRPSNRIVQCFACGGWGHTRPDCPFQNSGPGPALNSVSGFFGNQWPRQQQQLPFQLMPFKPEGEQKSTSKQ